MAKEVKLGTHNHLGTLSKGFLWLLSLVIATVVGAAINNYYSERSNQNAAVQQQNYMKIELFERTGNEMDGKFSSWSDAVVDKRDLKPIMQDIRTAIAQHSSTVTGLQPILGSENSNAYLEQLSVLRQLVDSSINSQTAIEAAQLHSKMIEVRWKLAEIAKGKVNSGAN
jgi:hypothetical protein